MATRIYLMRHAETTWNSERRIQGHLDAPLSPRGIRQTERLVTALREHAFDGLYASPLPRAMDTARPLAAALGLSVVPMDEFREVNQGAWESRLLDELLAEDGDRLRAWWEAPHTVRMPDGETLEEVQTRARPALEALARRHRRGTIAVVAHGGVNKTVLLWALGAPLAGYWRIRQHNACINIVEIGAPQPRVVLLNETAHLGEDAWFPP